MNILILGSRGQIGDHLNVYLKSKYNIMEYDILNSTREDLRIDNNQHLKKLIKKSDFVFFLAFDVGGSEYLKTYQDSFSFLMNNISIMKNTFTELYNQKKKFIFASTQMSNMIYSNYGVLKKIGENLTKTCGGVSVRFWNVFGIERDPEKTHVITDFILKGFKNNKVIMKTDGEEERDFMYADDCCRALSFIMKKYKLFSKKGYVDLNTGKSTKIKKVAKIIEKLFLKSGKIVKYQPSKKKDNLQFNKKNKSDLSFFNYWKPKYSLEKGIEKVFNYYIVQKK